MGIGAAGYTGPVPITAAHRCDAFASGKQPLDAWLRAHALDNEGKASRTYVVTPAGGDAVVAYYTLAAGSVALRDIPRKYRHDMPNPVPVMVLGRLALDRRHHGRGIGAGLLREAMRRTLSVARQAGVRMLVLHALDDGAAAFYARYGFKPFPADPRTMMLPIETIAASL